MTVAFPNAGRPGVLKVFSGDGDVTITGYSGKTVVIKAESSGENLMGVNDKAKGLKRISGTRFNVSTDDDENAVIITRPMGDEVDLDIQIPQNTSVMIGSRYDREDEGAVDHPNMAMQIIESIEVALATRIGGIMGGDIIVKNITGDMDISTFDGDVTLIDVSGTAVVNSLDGTVTAVFSGTSGGKPMAFSTIDGDVDVTLPSDIKATIIASNIDGDVFTDFDMDLVHEVHRTESDPPAMPVSPAAVNTPRVNGGPQVRSNTGIMGMPGNAITGKINGGGVEVLIKTIDGDILIRQGR
jgi:hypothetical protein